MDRLKEFREEIFHSFVSKAVEIEEDESNLMPNDYDGQEDKIDEMYTLTEMYRKVEDTMSEFFKEIDES